MFSTFETTGSGLTTYRKWMDAISDNVANLDTVRPTSGPAFQERFVVAQAKADDGNGNAGVEVSGVTYGSPQGRLVYEPSNPMADAQGNVRYPDVDLGDQMTSLLVAQRGYQANLAVVERAQAAYQAALAIGK